MPVISPIIEKSSSGIPPMFYLYTYVMNNPLKYTDPSGYLTAAQVSRIINRLWNYEFGGEWHRDGGGGGTFRRYTSDEDALNHNSPDGYGHWEPEYYHSFSTSGKLFRTLPKGVINGKERGDRVVWGDFSIDFSSEIAGWKWVPSEESIFTIDFFSVDAFKDPDFSFSDLVKPRDENITGLVPSKNNTGREYPNTYIGRWANYTRIPEITMDNQSQAKEQIQNFLNQANQAIQDYNTQVYDFYRDFSDPLYAIRSRRLDIASELFIKTLSLGFDVFFYFYVPTPYIPYRVPDPNLIDPDIY